jgi:hypothetical protein
MKKLTVKKASAGLKLNLNAQKKQISAEAKAAIDKIKANAKRGVSTTEIVANTEIYADVRHLINEYMKKHKVNYDWLSMAGPVGQQISIPVSGGRLMKFKLKQ